MSKVYIEKEKLTELADIIRTKREFANESTIMTLDDMLYVVDSLEHNSTNFESYLNKTLTSFSAYLPLLKSNAFSYFYNLSSVNLPYCKTIGSYAFYSCSALTNISLPNCTSIGGSIFKGCSRLTSISLPQCTNIEYNAFGDCFNLREINLQMCTAIPEGAFDNCIQLSAINLPNCWYIGAIAFDSCSSLLQVDGNNLTYISTCAFRNCSLLSSIVLQNCSIIGLSAFENCYNLKDIALDNCEQIYAGAFIYCSNITSLSFDKCWAIEASACRNCLNLSKVIFNTSLWRIGSYCFADCTALSNITFSTFSLPSINSNVFLNTPIDTSTYLGYFGSIYVPNEILSSVQMSSGWSYYSDRLVGYSIDTNMLYPYQYYQNSTITAISGDYIRAKQSCCYACANLASINLPSCSYIDKYAFYHCEQLNYCSLPICEYVDTNAFAGAFCSIESSITLSLNNCSSIGSSAFNCCNKISTVYLPKCVYINNYAFCNCTGLSNITLAGSTVCSLQSTSVFYNTPIYNSYFSQYGSIYVPASLVEAYKTASYWSYFADRITSIIS